MFVTEINIIYILRELLEIEEFHGRENLYKALILPYSTSQLYVLCLNIFEIRLFILCIRNLIPLEKFKQNKLVKHKSIWMEKYL